jgi:hypothetical protein
VHGRHNVRDPLLIADLSTARIKTGMDHQFSLTSERQIEV